MKAHLQVVKPNETIAKRRLGQHFLRDKGVIARFVNWIRPSHQDIILEIGAGQGALSSRLAPSAHRLIAVELDLDCIPALEKELAPFGSACIVAGDILQLDLKKLISRFLLSGLKLRIVGNLPYNIASPILERLFHLDLPVTDMFFMLQLEVAQRILAQPGCRQYGYLSVICQHRAEVHMGFKVSPSCFVPRPKVMSATISFKLKPIRAGPEFEADFEALTKAAFGYRRKTLANSLARHPKFARISNALLKHADIDGSRRAESLSVQEYERLTGVFQECFSSACE